MLEKLLKFKSWNSVFLFFIISTIALYYIFSHFINLSDADGYFHLAIAKLYYQQGFIDKLNWARFSIMSQHFGDKDFLFHVFLIPFVNFLPQNIGIPLVSSLLAALVLTTIYYLCLKSIGPRSWIIPLWLILTSANFAVRLTQLKAELFAIVILIFITWAVSHKKYLNALILTSAYCLCYSAYHIPLGLALLWFFSLGIFYKEWDFKIVISILLGSFIGLFLHPGFPSNLIVWYFQYISFLQFHTELTLPPELFPLTSANILIQNWGWFVGLWIIWRSSEKKYEEKTEAFREQIFFIVNAFVFILLFIFMQRFVTYVVPLTTFAVIFTMQKRGLILGAQTRLPGQRIMPFWLSFGFCLLLGISVCQYTYATLNRYGVFTQHYQENWNSFSHELKKGSKVAAPILSSHTYVWAAPQADYLCELDPVFMAKLFPELFEKQLDIWSGDEPDVPLVVKAYLKSDYVAFSNDLSEVDLYERLMNDPRVKLKHDNLDSLFEIESNNKNFVLDWMTISPYLKLPLEKRKILLYGTNYPRLSAEGERSIEGYIDGLRSNPNDSSASFVHFQDVDRPIKVTYELSCYGACKFWHNDQLVFSTNTPAKAILGHGVTFTLMLDQGPQIFTVQTFSYRKHLGFYLLERNKHEVLH
ncbi:MAG: hypothetical protein HQL15_05565 [Candidatus Omnitrophica bacterium]|nr:hypothetical protein [Candidatus Omnitrophota bacterium]